MNVKTDRFIIGIAVLMSSWASLLHAETYHFSGGTGEPNNPYQIAAVEELISIGSDPNVLDKHFILLNDIDLNPNLPGGRIFTKAVIAPSDSSFFWEGVPFTGVFNGHGHVLKNLTFQGNTDWSITSFIALFGNVAKGGVVSDLRAENASVNRQTGSYHGVLVAWNEGRIVRCGASGAVPGNVAVGVLAGYNRGEIVDCWAAGDVSGACNVGGLVGFNSYGVIVNSHAACRVLLASPIDFNYGGGLVGQNLNGQIVDCWATGDVSAYRPRIIGGLVGMSFGGVIANSYATGNVSAEGGGERLGGLVGGNAGTISDCYATGNVSGGDRSSSLGGLVGSGGFISDSYATGRVSAGQSSKDTGGLVGGSSLAKVEGGFWNVETSGLAASSGGTGLTTAQMQDAATYLAAGWDLAGESGNGTADLWLVPAGGGYPLLAVHSEKFEPHKLDGTGTAQDPYRIATVEDLDAINHGDLTACYRLEADIDLGQTKRSKSFIRYFDGTFDGAGRVFTGLTVRGGNNLGLFGDLGSCASITNVGIRDANITGTGLLGLLAAMNRGSIVACQASGTVAGSGDMGILTGWSDGNISDSYTAGSVSSDVGTAVGGLTGWNIGRIRRCYAAGVVSRSQPDAASKDQPGGLVGADREPPWSGVTFVRSLMDVTGEIYDSYFLIDTDSRPNNGCGIPLTDVQMRQRASFTNWDFDKIWMICEGKDYPRLRWELAPCE